MKLRTSGRQARPRDCLHDISDKPLRPAFSGRHKSAVRFVERRSGSHPRPSADTCRCERGFQGVWRKLVLPRALPLAACNLQLTNGASPRTRYERFRRNCGVRCAFSFVRIDAGVAWAESGCYRPTSRSALANVRRSSLRGCGLCCGLCRSSQDLGAPRMRRQSRPSTGSGCSPDRGARSRPACVRPMNSSWLVSRSRAAPMPSC
jgi:hypothetical protein